MGRKIRGIAYDSRKVEPGYAFVAIPGTNVDGHDYIPQAAARGASLIVCQRPPAHPPLRLVESQSEAHLLIALVPDTRRALADLAAAYHGHPSRALTVVGVTGTDGKTSTCYLLTHILEAAGIACGMATSTGFKVRERAWFNDTRQTTQESLEVQQLLRQAVDAGARCAVLEATSHALSEPEDCADPRMYVGRRLLNCDFRIGVLTNFGRDHLDYHGTVERYRAAKARLFRDASEAVLNADDPQVGFFREAVGSGVPAWGAAAGRLTTYGLDARDCAIRATEVVQQPEGLAFTVVAGGITIRAYLPMYGRHNVANALAAVAAAWRLSVDLATAVRALASFGGVPGRMEEVCEGQPFRVFVDYAHTPQAFASVLATARSIASGRVLAVFGCSGERDASKRSVMGEQAARSCAYFCLTDEDPHREDPAAIVAQIEAGALAGGAVRGEQYDVDLDRRSAMRRAFAHARPGDVVLLTGKGHERCMLVGTGRVDWNDTQVARECLRELLRSPHAVGKAPQPPFPAGEG